MRNDDTRNRKGICFSPLGKRAASVLACGLMTALFVFLPGCGAGQTAGRSTGQDAQVGGGSSSADDADTVDTFSATDFVMDTVLQETIYGSRDLTGDIQPLLEKLEKEKLSWREADSEAAQINSRCQNGETVTMSEDFYRWVEVSLDLAEKSGGAFDPTIGNLTRLWNIEGENPVVPPQAEIDEVLSHVGYENISIEEKDKTISMAADCTLDLGAVGKGIACDVVRNYLRGQEEVSGAVIAVGGSILTWGSKPDGSDWSVAVQDPKGEDGSYMGVLQLAGTACVSTSGDYEKYFEKDGKRYHHILDPADGYPSESGLSSVTVVCPDAGEWKEYAGLLSDGLSTACFVLGEERGRELLEQYGMEGVFIDKEKNVTVTDGLTETFSLLSGEYRIAG